MTSPLTPETVAALWSPSDAQVSPDGRWVAWTAAPYGTEGEHPETGIWVASVDGTTPARRWTRAADDSTPRWSPDGTRLAFLSDRAERGTPGLYVLDLAGGEATPVAVRKRSVGAFAWAPDGARIAFLAPDDPTAEDERREKERDDADVYGERWAHQRLWLVSATGGDADQVWAPDLHLAELAWSPDGSRIGLLGRRSPLVEHLAATEVWLVDVAEPRQPGVLLAAAGWASDLGWTDPDTLVYLAPHGHEPQRSGTAWALPATGAPARVIGTGIDEPRCTGGLVPGTGRVLLALAEGLANRLEWVDMATGERTTAYDVPGDLSAVSAAETPDGPVLAVVRYGDALVPEVEAGPPGALRVVSDHGAGVADVPLARPEVLTATGADGLPLDAVVIRPVGAGDGPWPTAVLVHGGPYSRSGLWSHTHPLDWGQLLAQHGYAVVLPNYRGGVGHGDAFARSARGDMGGAEWGDVLSVVDAAVAAGIADPDRLGIGGWSQGGFLTAWAVTATDRFKVGVMGAGVSDWSMMAATSDLPDFEAALGGSRPWDGPGPHRAAQGSPLSYAERRTTPLLILHGANDLRVPHSQAVAFHRALAGQDAPVQLVTYPREPHGVRERRHQVDVQTRVLEWFDRYLGPAADVVS